MVMVVPEDEQGQARQSVWRHVSNGGGVGLGVDLVSSGEKGFVAVRAVGAGRMVSRTTRPGLHGSECWRCIQAKCLHLAPSAGLLQETREGTACTRLPAMVGGLKWDFRGVLFSFCSTGAEMVVSNTSSFL